MNTALKTKLAQMEGQRFMTLRKWDGSTSVNQRSALGLEIVKLEDSINDLKNALSSKGAQALGMKVISLQNLKEVALREKEKCNDRRKFRKIERSVIMIDQQIDSLRALIGSNHV